MEARGAASFLQWLSTIAVNEIRDAYDRQIAGKRDLRRETSLSSNSTEGVGNHLVALSALPEEHVLLAEVRDLLDQEVSRLPEDQRRVVLLRDYCGGSWEEIAAELGRESGAARQLHQRAWIRLRQALRPKLEDPR